MIFKISKWATINKWFALGIMVPLHIILMIFAVILGKYLVNSGIVLGTYFKYFVFGISLIIFFFYPVKSEKYSLFKFDRDSKLFKYSFTRRKIYDGILILCGFFIIVFIAQRHYTGNLSEPWFIKNVHATEIESSDKNISVNSTYTYSDYEKAENSVISDDIYIQESAEKDFFIKRIFKKKPPREKLPPGSVIGIILIILAVVAATFGIVLLSCYLMCSGLEALGALLLIGGVAGLTVLSIFSIRQIIKKANKKRLKNEEEL